MAACIPTLRPFFHKVWKGEKSLGSGSGGSGPKLSNSTSTFFSKGRGRGNQHHHHRKLDDSVLDLDPREQDLEAHVLEQMDGERDRERGHDGDGDAAAEGYAESDSSQKGICRTLQVNMEWNTDSLSKRVSRFPFVPDIANDGRCESMSEREGKKKHKSANGRLM